jgi:hypothetical protein
MQARLTLGLAAAALVVALLGSTPLGHALVSNVPRNSVGAPQLKRNAVTAQKLAPNAVRTAHVLNGTLLAVDFKAGQLPAGPKGDKGDKGDPGPVGVSEREVVTAQSVNNSTPSRQVTATCPAGKQALGGGGSLSLLVDVALNRSLPEGANGWTASAREINSTGSTWFVSAYVVCAKVS